MSEREPGGAATAPGEFESPGRKLDGIVDGAVRALPGIDHVTITRAHQDGTLEVIAASDEVGPQFDRLQSKHQEGPCVHAARTDDFVRVAPARHEQRWPNYLRDALELGLTAQLAVSLQSSSRGRYSLNLYSTSSETLTDDLDDWVETFGAYAATTLGRSKDAAEYQAGLLSRTQIGMALGLVMARYGLDDEQAFLYLRRRSSQENVKVRDLASSLVQEANSFAGRPALEASHG